MYLRSIMGDLPRNEVVVTFYGVRGSTPCSCPSLNRYGGNTSCVTVETVDADPIVLDLGTGLRNWGRSIEALGSVDVHALVTHLHWDHVQGLPFFSPLQHPQTSLNVYGPGDHHGTLGESFTRFMTPPFFPICTADLPAEVNFHDALDCDFEIAGAQVMARPVPHTGPTAGYRIERNGVSIAYIPDHQEPVDDPTRVADSVLELCAGVDVLIHDSQLRRDEFAAKSTWGHCTPEYAVEVARQAGVKQLVLFHHDPGRDDDAVDHLTGFAREIAADSGIDVIAAAEGVKLTLSAEI